MKNDHKKIDKQKLAELVWDNAFFSGLNKFSRAELIETVCILTQKLDYYENVLHINDRLEDGYIDYDDQIDERDFKDIAVDGKYTLVETLVPDFFVIEKDKEKSIKKD